METYKVTEMYRLFDLDKINDIAIKVHTLPRLIVNYSFMQFIKVWKLPGACRPLLMVHGAVKNKMSPKAIFVKT